MLILTRKIDQSVLIGDSIKVTVLAVDGERIKLGIEAPDEVSIMRLEVLDKASAEAE